MLQEEAEDQGLDAFLPDLEKIRSAGRHLLGLINNILDLSKIEAGKMDLYLERFDLKEVVTDVAATSKPLFEKRHNGLTLAIAGDAGAVHADQTKVRQILFNLLSNASKFTENGTITLTVSRSAEAGRDGVTMSVADSGIGMTPEQIGKLFQPFTQADASTTRKFGGTGLGLTIVKRFCELMGGHIAVASEAVHRALAHGGWQVAEANNGRVALTRLAGVKPAAVILDLTMPEMDGFEFLDEMRKNPDWADVPVVVLTAKELTNEERTRLNGHVEKVIRKGAVGQEDILNEVRRLVAVHARQSPAVAPPDGREIYATTRNGNAEHKEVARATDSDRRG